MITSLKDTLSALLAFCEGNPPFTDSSPHQGSVLWGFDVFVHNSPEAVEQTVKLFGSPWC